MAATAPVVRTSSVQSSSQTGAPATPLRLGDTILLYAQRKGYVFSDISSNVIQSVAVCPVVPPFQQGDPNLPDIHGACFRVLSANKYKAQQRLSQLKQGLKSKGKQKLSPQEREQLKTAERNLSTETVDNVEEQKRVRGITLAYGTKIQLQHVFTGKYLCVNSSQTSALESTNLKMDLTSENSQNCIFTILPRYKVRSVGGEVRMKDEVVFESTKTEGQYLHCSTRLLERTGQHLHSSYHELNLSATESAFTIVPHFCPKEDTESKDVMRAGSVVHLFHWERCCYLVSEGSFAGIDDTEDPSNVYLRKRKTDRGRLKTPSTSAITFWSIEKQRDPLSGEAVHWRELCRIRHLPTRQYLAVVNDQGSYKVGLTARSSETESETDTIFSLIPVIEGEDNVTFGSYARIYHNGTDSWLHAEKVKKRKQSTAEVEGLQWDGGEHFCVSASRQMDQDPFSLMMVSPDLVSKFNFVAGMVPILQAYLAERRQQDRKLNQKQAVIMEQALSELVEFMSDPHARCKDHQKLVRNLNVLELLVSCLKQYDKRQDDSLLQQKVCQAGYKVIEVFLQGNSHKNELYLSKFIEFFETQMKMGLCAENMLIELVRDNLKIVSTFSMSRVDDIICFVLEGEKDCRFFDYLGVLCVCEGKALVSRQNHILTGLVCRYYQDLFIQTEVMPDHDKHGNTKQVFYQDRESRQWRRLTEFAHKAFTKKKQRFADTWNLMESQLDLFAKLAKGNNSKAIKTITEEPLRLVTFDEALAGASDYDLHPSIRLKYVELLVVLFVDVGNEHSFLESMAHSFVYSELQPPNPLQEEEHDLALSLTGERNSYAPRLWDWLLHVVKSNQVLVCSEDCIMKNTLLAEILQLLELLMNFGYYDNMHCIRTIVHPLTAMLDGRTDIPYARKALVQTDLLQYSEDTRFKDSPAARTVFVVKHRIMKIFDLIFNYRIHLRLKSFVCEYKTLMCESNASGRSHRGRRRWREDPSKAVSINIHEPRDWAMDSVINPLLETGEELCRKRRGPPVELMMLQEKEVNWQRSQRKALGSITRTHLSDIMEPTAVFEDIGQDFVDILMDTANYDDANLVVWSMHLLNRFFSSESEVFDKARDAQLLVSETSALSLKMISSQVASFRRITQLELDVSLMAELEEILEKLRRLCVIDKDLRKPNHHNQKILLNYGILNDVLSLILHRLKGSSVVVTLSDQQQIGRKKEEAAKEKLLQKAYQFLAAFTRGQRVVQELLFEQVDALLGAQYAIQDMALVISEVFTNYHELCVKLQESQVEQVFRLITRSSPPEQAALLQALKSMTITRVNDIDLEVMRNQTFVLKYFSSCREFFNPVLGQDANESKTRLHIVTASADDDPRLLVLLSVVDLLAACCKGRNDSVQSSCQNILTSDELLELLCNDSIAISRKLPFCLYLVWVYLDADLDATHTRITLNINDPRLLQYLQQARDVVAALVHELPLIQPREEMVRHLRYTHDGAEETRARVTAEAARWLAPGVLVYFLDGILPLFRVYYEQSLDVLPTDEEAAMRLLRSLAEVLLNSVPVVWSFLGSTKEAFSLQNALLTLTSHPGVDEYLEVSAEVRREVKQFIEQPAITKNRTLLEFEELCSEEQQLKASFSQFVSAYEKACNGLNTLQHQLGVKNKFIREREYTTDPCSLPLGPGFQKFVSCFVSREKSSYRVLPQAENLIRQLDVSFNKLKDLTEAEQARQDALDIKCLQVLRAIIYNEIVRIDPELKENQPNKYRKLAATFVESQNAVQRCAGNTAAKVIPMLIHPNDQVGAEVLAFLSVFMYDGNEVVQDGCEFLCHRKEGQFLSSIKKRLDMAVSINGESRALLSQLLIKQRKNHWLMTIYEEEVEEQKPRNRVASYLSRRSGIAAEGDNDSEDSEDQLEPDGEGYEMHDLSHVISVHSHFHPSANPVARDVAESLAFRDPTHVQLTLQMLGLMCDGQNHNLQNFLRHQPESIPNVNLIEEVARFAPRYCSSIDQNNVHLVIQVLQTLVEVCVGNYYNQLVVFECQIVDFLNQILQTSSFPGCAAREVLDMKASAVELLEVMLEDTHVDTPKLARSMLKSLDIEAVHDTLVYFYHMQNDEEMQRLRKDDDAQRALFTTFHVVKHLCDFEGVPREKLVPIEPLVGDEEHPRRRKILEAWKYCSERSKSVEVLYENLDGEKILSKVHFRYNPDDKLSEEMVERVKWEVSRKSAEDKVQDFLKWMKAITGMVHHLNSLKEHWYTRMCLYRRDIWHWTYIFLTIVLNILMLVSWKDPAEVTPETEMLYTSFSLGFNNASNDTVRSGFGLPTIPVVELWFGYYLLLSFGSLHLIMTIKIVFTYFLVNWPNFYFIPNIFYTIRNQKRDKSYTDIAFLGSKTFYCILLLSWSVLSLAFWGYFYPLCLVHIIISNDTLQKVLRSVTKNWRSLCWVGALELVVLYIYGLVSYAAYQNYFDDPRAGSHCRTLFQCVVSVIRLGILHGGGLITNADIAPFRDETLIFLFPAYIPRTVFDVSFFIIVTTVGLGIFFGIIIDTFSQLGKEKYNAEDDAKDFCFICNFPAHEFDRKAEGFLHHVTCEHNMWDYVYFSLELDRIDSSDQNAIQLYVHKQIQEESPRFFPVLKARCFKHDVDDTKIRLTRMEEKVQMILDYLANEDKSKQAVLRRQKSQMDSFDSAR